MMEDKSHRRIRLGALLSQYRTCKHRVVPTVLPQVYFNLQQSTQHQMIKGRHFAAVIKCTSFFPSDIQDLLEDKVYTTDVEVAEEDIDLAK